MKLEWSTFIVAKFLNNDAKKCWQNLSKVRLQCSMPLVYKSLLARIRSFEEWNWNGQHLLLPNFWTMTRRNADITFSKRGSSALCLGYRNHFWPELGARKNGIGMVNIYYCQIFEEWFEEMLTKPSQSVLRVLCAFGTETTFRRNWKLGSMKMEWSTFIVARILDNDLKKC